MEPGFWEDIRRGLTPFGVLMYVGGGFLLWLGIPLLMLYLADLCYAADARLVGLPKPEQGYQLPQVEYQASAFLMFFAMWTVWIWRMGYSRRHWVIPIINVFDPFSG